MTLEELKKKLRDSLADAKERGVRIPRAWFEDDLCPDSLKELGLKVVHVSTSPYSWIKHEKGEIKLMEIEQFCHAHDLLCIAVKSEDDALEVVAAYQFFGDEEKFVAREINPMYLPTKEEGRQSHSHPSGPCSPIPGKEEFFNALGAVMGQLGEITED